MSAPDGGHMSSPVARRLARIQATTRPHGQEPPRPLAVDQQPEGTARAAVDASPPALIVADVFRMASREGWDSDQAADVAVQRLNERGWLA